MELTRFSWMICFAGPRNSPRRIAGKKLSACRKSSGNAGRNARRPGPGDDTRWWTNSRTWSGFVTGMNGDLTPAITRRRQNRSRRGPPIRLCSRPSTCGGLLLSRRFQALRRHDAGAGARLAFEIALLGRNGLDYAAPDEKYELRALPERKFSGLHLMCLMFAGFKRSPRNTKSRWT